jgi:N-dimethylarginine dimethylaminohydrolase
MRAIPKARRSIDHERAFTDFSTLYAELASSGLVFLLPPDERLQDQIYVSNLGVVPPHLGHVAIVSKFRSRPRVGESEPGAHFLKELGFDVFCAPYHFEGEADLKYVRGNLYVGAYGLRTSLAFLRWFSEEFDAAVIPVRITDPDMYHLDCLVLPTGPERAAVCCEILPESSRRTIEKFVEIFPVPHRLAKVGATNCVVVGRRLLGATFVDSFASPCEPEKISIMASIADWAGLDFTLLHWSEFAKSGADLSCCVLPLNPPRRAVGRSG